MGKSEPEQVREMLTAKQVLALIPFGRTTLFRLERDRLFPQGQPVSPHKKLWFKDEVVAWQHAMQDPTSALSRAFSLRVARTAKRPPVQNLPRISPRPR